MDAAAAKVAALRFAAPLVPFVTEFPDPKTDTPDKPDDDDDAPPPPTVGVQECY